MLDFTDTQATVATLKDRGNRRVLARLVIALLFSRSAIGSCFAQDVGWPREKSNAAGTLIYYQPQLNNIPPIADRASRRLVT
jgi:hypothetical protein